MRGTTFAAAPRMGVSRYQDLVVWQLAEELKRNVYELVDNSSARDDFGFRDQIKGSASSSPTNIAEGFGYYRHPEFARHVRIAKSEMLETHSLLGDGVDRHHWSREKALAVQELANRAAAASTRLLKFLMTTEAPSHWPKRDNRR